jgi:hypothetical protein
MSELREWLLKTILDVYERKKHTLLCEKEFNHTFRMILEKPIFDKLRELYMSKLKETWIAGNGFSNNPKHTIFIYETRCHENLEFLIYNLYYFTRSRSWAVLFYCTAEVESYIRSTVGPLADTIQFTPIPSVFSSTDSNDSHGENRNIYNDMMLSMEFWQSLSDRSISHILVAQTDCYLRKPLVIDVDAYDYIPAPWAWAPNSPGGGGLTIRRVQKALDIHKRFPELACGQGEDFWFSEGIVKVGGTVDNFLFAESYMNPDAVGVHQWWTFVADMDDIKLDVFEKYMELEVS